MLATAGSASAQTTAMSPAPVAPAIEATPIPRAPKPDFAPLTYFVGRWSCSSKSARRPTPQRSTVTVALEPGGRWMRQTTVNQPTSWYPYVDTGTDLFTYDRDTKRWIDVGYDTAGNYGLTGTTGWKGDTMVWKDLAFTPTAQVTAASDFTITKVSATKFTSAYGFTTGTGRSVAVTGVCTKT
jgi:hypothetical protein